MATIVLPPQQQDRLGKKSTPLSIEQARLQEQAVIDQRWERDWFKDDTPPDLSDRLSFEFFVDRKKAIRGKKPWGGW